MAPLGWGDHSCDRVRLARFQSDTGPSVNATSARLPSGEISTELIGPRAATAHSSGRPAAVSHNRRKPSVNPVIAFEPSTATPSAETPPFVLSDSRGAVALE